MKQTVAYLGPEGTFTQEAAQCLLQPENYTFVSYRTIADVLNAVYEKKNDLGVVPVENAIEGSVNLTLDWLAHKVDVPITAEVVYPVSQHLLVHSFHQGKDWSAYTKVVSHPQALAQCQLFLRKYLGHAEQEYANSTAEAARMVSEHPDEPWLAIGTRLAQKMYHLSFREQAIEDYEQNFTRFIVVGEKPAFLTHTTEAHKTTLLVSLPEDFPGALHQVLAAFAWRKINLTHLESRPTKKGLGSYHFFIDAEMKADNVLLQGAMREIEALGCEVRLLGSFPCYIFTESLNRVHR